MIKRLFITYITIILMSVQANAQTASFVNLEGSQREAFKNNLYSSSEKINTLECNFVQKQILSMLSDEVVSKGTMTFKKTDRLLWIYNSPYEFVFLMNNGRITTKSGGKTSSFDSGSSPLMKELCKIMVAGLKGDTKSLETSFNTKYLTNGTQIKVVMNPRNKSLASVFKQIDLLFDAGTFIVSSIEMAEPSGDKTSISVSNVKINGTVDDKVFDIH
jgi:outer membrane lipoprotein carrier protein